jgi:CheY-like chemotaxis protein
MSIAGMRILLVEDEAVIAMMAEDMLMDLGCVVVAIAATVESALDHVANDVFDKVLLDMNLGGDSSEPVAIALRDAGKPFIFTTGYGSAGRPDGFADAPLITKPYTTHQIAAALTAT